MKIIILGCGSSLGSPWITNYWGDCNKKIQKILEQDVQFLFNKITYLLLLILPQILKNKF